MTSNQLSEAHNVALSTTNWPDTMDTKADQRLQQAATRKDTRGTNVNYGWPTTRCYPRTTREAFPDDIENAQWWYPPEQRWQDKLMLAVGAILWVVIAVYLWKTT